MCESPAEVLRREQSRVSDVLSHYREIGSAGAFGAAMIEAELAKAGEASLCGDVVEMARSIQALERIKG